MPKVYQLGSPSTLLVLVRPDVGGQITSLVDAGGHEFLAQGYPRPSELSIDASYAQAGLGGIDDCLPSIAGGRYPEGPHAGIPIPDHGELWQRSSEVLDDHESGITLRTYGLKLPFELTRTARVDSSALVVEYQLKNLATYPWPLIWAAHALLEPSKGAFIDLPGITHMQRELDNLGLPTGIAWPGSDKRRFSHWDEFPEGGYLKAFAPMPDSGVVRMVHPRRGVALEIHIRAERKSYIGVWINRRGFPSASPVGHIGLEPTFGSSDSLQTAVASETALVLARNQTVRWSVEYRPTRWEAAADA